MLEAAQAAGRGAAPHLHGVQRRGGRRQLEASERGPWGRKFRTVVAAWRRAWDRVIPFFAFPPAVRRVLYTTNAIESIHA
jgi:putative transposase